MICTINGTEYRIDEFAEGWAWTTDEGEADGWFATALEAQQDALNHASEREADDREARQQLADEAKYGTYEQQVNAYWRGTRL